jgi:hypothetical protein
MGVVALALGAVIGPIAQAATHPTVFADCLQRPTQRPDEILLACGDGTQSIGISSWTGWGSTFAAGRGTLEIDDCKPSCVAGTDHDYAVVVLLTGRQTCKPGGKIAYRTLTVAYADGKPHTSFTQAFPCHPAG